jgi:hypothetical protein
LAAANKLTFAGLFDFDDHAADFAAVNFTGLRHIAHLLLQKISVTINNFDNG